MISASWRWRSNFHKASLIHDDIEDGDATRYGEKTLHEEHGVPVALNVGDLLIGEGYRLIGACGIPPIQKAEMLTVAAEGQRQLCRGQGAELCWARKPQPLNSTQVLQIFRQKTAPAFEVALKLGALYADADRAAQPGGQPLEAYEEVSGSLQSYSEALGIAYQIRDDLSDHGSEGETDDLAALRPGLLLAIALERAEGENRKAVEALWRRVAPEGMGFDSIEKLFAELGAPERARTLLEAYKEEAIRSLREVENPNLKGLLRRVIGKIFNDTEIKGWCKEFETKNIASRATAVPA